MSVVECRSCGNYELVDDDDEGVWEGLCVRCSDELVLTAAAEGADAAEVVWLGP